MALVRKSNSKTTHQKKQIIQINPYENPENVLGLMSNICSAKPSADTDIYWKIVTDAYNKEVRGLSLWHYLHENRGNLSNIDFESNLGNLCRQISWSISTRENTEHTQIVVAGGFSSGKSSFLNRLTKCSNLLPTGVEPVSVVKTYLYCSRNTHSISVQGVNLKNVLVNLNPSVLQAIQHANKSNVFLASVLDKLFVEIPSEELNGLVFIDTPGYNNSDKANDSNGKTDKETALEAMKEGNVLFWLTSIDRPTLTTDDMEMIASFNGRKVLIFNKTDKIYNSNSPEASLKEIKNIVDKTATELYKKFGKEEIIDIIAYSALDNTIYYSYNKLTLTEIVQAAKSCGNGMSELNKLKQEIEELFESEISSSEDMLGIIQKEYKERVKEKEEKHKQYIGIKHNDNKYITYDLKEVLIDGYNGIMAAADKITDASLNSLEKFRKFLESMYEWDSTDHECWNNTLTPKIDYANRQYDSCCNNHNAAIDYNYYKEEYRQGLVADIQDFIADTVKEAYDNLCQECTELLERKNNEECLIKNIQEYKDAFMAALNMAINEYQRQNKATEIQKEKAETPNIFECIEKGNYKQFLQSFENGVDCTMCNAKGYNPLTWAVQSGNNQMVQFLLKHDADPTMKDQRGYNAFHTAVENQYRYICKMLLDYDSDLIETETAGGESIQDLAQKQTFTQWIEQEIDNLI